MKVSEVFSLGGGCGGYGGGCGGGYGGCGGGYGGGHHGYNGYSSFGDYNNRHFGRSHHNFDDGGHRFRRRHRDDGLLGIRISL
jgi:hypothetical protein